MLLCSHSICTLRSSGVSFNSYFPSTFCRALSFHESTFTLGHISLLSFFPICILTLMQTLASWPCQEPKKDRKYLKRKEKKSKFLNSVKFKIYPKLNVEPKKNLYPDHASWIFFFNPPSLSLKKIKIWPIFHYLRS